MARWECARKRRSGAMVLSILLLGGCGGMLTPTMGGESHFLRICTSDCGDGLDCISGVCTRGCVVNNDGCHELDAQAECTDQSIEPGAVAVCDVSCQSDPDCVSLSRQHVCDAGYCRGPALEGLDGSGGAGNTGQGGNAAGGTVGDGGSGAASGGGLVREGELGSVLPCPDPIVTDAIRVRTARIEGDRLILDVEGGACGEEHYYGACYEQSFLESYPVQGTLHVLYDANGDTCEERAPVTIEFDLRGYAEYFARSYPGEGVIITTNFGTYATGELDCDERDLAVQLQTDDAIGRMSLSCEGDADCEWVHTGTTCSGRCGVPGSTSDKPALEEALQAISDSLCVGYEDDCGPVVLPPCIAPMFACVDHVCLAL